MHLGGEEEQTLKREEEKKRRGEKMERKRVKRGLIGKQTKKEERVRVRERAVQGCKCANTQMYTKYTNTELRRERERVRER